MSDLDAIWPHGSQDPIGQAAEFLVWAPLITQSGGGLHVFLPVLDRGLDAVIHRLSDGAYLALQVKGKTSLHGAEAVIAVYDKHLFTSDQLVIGVHLDGDSLGPHVLVADAATFRKKAGRVMDRARLLLVADMPIHPIRGHSWSEDLVPFDRLAERLGAARLEPALALEAAFVPDFTDVDVFIDPEGDDWRLTIVARPVNRTLTRDLFPYEGLAVSRAFDFTNLMRNHWPDVRIHRRYQSQARPLRG